MSNSEVTPKRSELLDPLKAYGTYPPDPNSASPMNLHDRRSDLPVAYRSQSRALKKQARISGRRLRHSLKPPLRSKSSIRSVAAKDGLSNGQLHPTAV
jgi:hypothetical protein